MMRAVILFAHGSRDPLWAHSIETVAQQLRQQYLDAMCSCAYLELTEPDLPTATAQLVQAGCTQLTILPMFIGTGRHARVDLPVMVEQLRQCYPDVHFSIATPVGEDARVIRLLADIAQGFLE